MYSKIVCTLKSCLEYIKIVPRKLHFVRTQKSSKENAGTQNNAKKLYVHKIVPRKL